MPAYLSIPITTSSGDTTYYRYDLFTSDVYTRRALEEPWQPIAHLNEAPIDAMEVFGINAATAVNADQNLNLIHLDG
jgi:hypothetical protein